MFSTYLSNENGIGGIISDLSITQTSLAVHAIALHNLVNLDIN